MTKTICVYTFKYGQYLFEWDGQKNNHNKQKHTIGFEEAVLVFDDPFHIELYDTSHSDKEDRFLAIGTVLNILIVLVVYTERNQHTPTQNVAEKRQVLNPPHE